MNFITTWNKHLIIFDSIQWKTKTPDSISWIFLNFSCILKINFYQLRVRSEWLLSFKIILHVKINFKLYKIHIHEIRWVFTLKIHQMAFTSFEMHAHEILVRSLPCQTLLHIFPNENVPKLCWNVALISESTYVKWLESRIKISFQ